MKYPEDYINKVICGDCLDVMKNIPDKSIDSIITSPPYNVGWNNMNGKDFTRYKTINDKMDKDDYLYWTNNILDELLRITKKHIFYNIQMLSNNKNTVLNIFSKYKDKIKDIIIWHKTQAPPAIEPGVMNTAFEFIIILSNYKPEKRKFYDSKIKGNFNNVIYGNNASSNVFAKEHKATFPIYLPEQIIQNFTNEGDIILDPFLGTGTTCVACNRFNRKYIGIDISKEYCKIAEERLRQKPLF